DGVAVGILGDLDEDRHGYILSVPTRSATWATRSRRQNSPSSRAMRRGEAGSQKLAVPTWTAWAPAMRNSAASSPEAMPPRPTTGILTASAAWYTKRSAMGLMAGPERPPKPAPMRGRRDLASMASAMKVLTRERASA